MRVTDMWLRWSIVVALLAAALTASQGPAAGQPPIVLRTALGNEAITPVTARFLASAIEKAERRRAACLMIELDTPGGLADSTRELVKRMLQSEIPVVIYVSPSGARAASAGVFLTLAAHVAAMAPGTVIGAAHPVPLGGIPGAPAPQPSERKETPQQAASPVEEKILNDTVAWARALAQLRGRNAELAARTVRESASLPSSEAVRAHLVDFEVPSVEELLARIEGRQVQLLQGPAKIQVAGARLERIDMWWGERVLSAIANPNIAFLLLIFGFYGILLELYTPGWGVSGTVGVVCLLLGFFALSVLPINYTGLLLILVALALFAAEAFVPSHGALTLGATACLVIGGLMLVDSPAGFARVSLRVLLPVALATAAITFFLAGSIVRVHRTPALTGSEAMAGEPGVAQEDFVLRDGQYEGMIETHGELWEAVSAQPVAVGARLAIEGRQGLTLRVRPLSERNNSREGGST